jgi:DNA-binding protein HU-beta
MADEKKTMTKTDLVKEVAEKANLSQKQAADAINEMIATVTAALKAGTKVTITGFGTWEVRPTAARTGTNPSTGEKIAIAAGKRISFSAGAELKKEAAGKSADAKKPATKKPATKGRK